MAKYEYQRDGFQPIPTPEEEAQDALRAEGNRHSGRAMLAMLFVAAVAFFREEIALYGSLIIDSFRGCCG